MEYKDKGVVFSLHMYTYTHVYLEAYIYADIHPYTYMLMHTYISLSKHVIYKYTNICLLTLHIHTTCQEAIFRYVQRTLHNEEATSSIWLFAIWYLGGYLRD